MPGKAEQLLLAEQAKPAPSLVQLLHEKGGIHATDLALSQYLLKKHANASEAITLFLCYLSAAARQGYTHVKVSNTSQLEPAPSFCFKITENLPPETFKKIDQHIVQAVTQLPESLMAEFAIDKPLKLIIRSGDAFYFHKYWKLEQKVKEYLCQLDRPPAIGFDLEVLTKELPNLSLEPEQQQAIYAAFSHGITLISGGPGTGKTHTAGQLIRLIWNALPQFERQRFQIMLAAPTGKAAANLQISLQKAFANQAEAPSIQAKTLHALLGLQPNRIDRALDQEIDPLDADLILIDESSMVDTQLFAYLLSAIKPGARLILLGDKFQLPPIGVGTPFADLLEKYKQNHSSQAIELRKCLRTDLQEIVDLAQSVNAGHAEKILQAPQKHSNICYRPICSDFQTQVELVEHALPYFEQLNDTAVSDQELLQVCNRFRILSPLRKGLFGVENLNRLFAEMVIQKMAHRTPCLFPIMVCQNNYHLELFNGDVGILIRQNPERDSEGDYAIFSKKRLPALMLPRYEYAYCLSVHKSQGSEFDHVLLLLSQGAEAFGREMAYTAITRAKQKLEIWGESSVIEQIVRLKR